MSNNEFEAILSANETYEANETDSDSINERNQKLEQSLVANTETEPNTVASVDADADAFSDIISSNNDTASMTNADVDTGADAQSDADGNGNGNGNGDGNGDGDQGRDEFAPAQDNQVENNSDDAEHPDEMSTLPSSSSPAANEGGEVNTSGSNNSDNAGEASENEDWQQSTGEDDDEPGLDDLEETDKIPKGTLDPARNIWSFVSPDNVLNRRLLACVSLLVVGGFAFGYRGASSSDSDKPKPEIIQPAPQEAYTFAAVPDPAQLSTPARGFLQGDVEEEKKVTIPDNKDGMVAVEQRVAKKENTPPTNEAPKQFAIVMRAGERSAQGQPVTEEEKKEQEKKANAQAVLQGLPIKLMLLEPFQTGISSNIIAQVMEDVRDSDGNLLIPVGSRAVIPLLGFESEGRVFNDQLGSSLFNLPNGEKIYLRGMVKGKDGFPGIGGKVRKAEKKNFFRRLGQTMGRVVARGAGTAAGAPEIEQGVNDSIGQGVGKLNRDVIVELTVGTRFSFHVGI